MAIYQPRNLQPYLQCIDATKSNTFSCQINGDECVSYYYYLKQIRPYRGDSYGKTRRLSSPLYNGDILDFSIYDPDYIQNGNDYVWGIKTYQRNKDIKVCQGIVGGCTTTLITIADNLSDVWLNTLAEKCHYLRIGGETRQVKSFDVTLKQFHMEERFSSSVLEDTAEFKAYYSEEATADDLIYTGTILNNSTVKLVLNPPGWDGKDINDCKVKICRDGGHGEIVEFEGDYWTQGYGNSLTLKEALDVPFEYGDPYEIYTNYAESSPECPFYARSTPEIDIDILTNITSISMGTEYFNEEEITWYDFDYDVFRQVIGDLPGQYDIVGWSSGIGIYYTDPDGNETVSSHPNSGISGLTDLGFDCEAKVDVLSNVLFARVTVNEVLTVKTLTRKEYTFTGLYSQAENVSMKFHKWTLWMYDDNDEMVIIDETENLYSFNLNYTYNSFRSGHKYAIQFEVEDVYGRQFSTTPIDFLVQYNVPLEVDIRPEIKLDCKKTAIDLFWGDICEFPMRFDTNVIQTLYDDGTHTFSNQPNKVFLGREVVSTTVDPHAQVVISVPAPAGLIISDAIYLKNYDYIYYDTWQKNNAITEDSQPLTGNMETTENFCITWRQQFYEDFVGGKYHSDELIVDNKMPNDITVHDFDQETFLQRVSALGEFDNPVYYVIANVAGSAWTIDAYYVDTGLPAGNSGIFIEASMNFTSALSRFGIDADYYYDLPEGEVLIIKPAATGRKVIMQFEREDDEGVVHFYSVWLEDETSLEMKYKILFDLDGVQGEYIWNNRKQNFCLQGTDNINLSEDYIYADTLNQSTQTWQDNQFFVENGTREEVLSKYWWKFIMTKNQLLIRREG